MRWCCHKTFNYYVQKMYWKWYIRRKRYKQSFNNYRPVPLPPILGKIFEKMPFNSSRTFSRKHSTLWQSIRFSIFYDHLCEFQLLYIAHDIYEWLDCNPPKEVRGIFPRYIWSFWQSLNTSLTKILMILLIPFAPVV